MVRRGCESVLFTAGVLLLCGATTATFVLAAAFLGQPSAQLLIGRILADQPIAGSVAAAQLLAVAGFAGVIAALSGVALVRRERRRSVRLEERLGRLTRAAEQTGELITVVNRKGRIEFVNAAVERITGYSREELLAGRCGPWLPWYESEEVLEVVRSTVLGGANFSGTVACRRKDGAPLVLHEEASAVADEKGRVLRFISTATDLTREKRYEARLKYLAAHDPVTGLPNRRRFAAELDQRLEKGRRATVMIVDVDRFNLVNDLLGASAGDELLRRLGATLRCTVREGDFVARLGSDEFGIIHDDGGRHADAVALAEQLRRAVSGDSLATGQPVVTTVSIGIAVGPRDGTDGPTLLRHAGMALARAKAQGRNGILGFSPDLSQEVFETYSLERNLARALGNGEYEVDYQPYCDLASRRITGAEALIRWSNEELGIVSPALFIPALEESGAIVEVGEWVLRSACRQLRDWSRARKPVGVAVNLSQVQFRHRDLVALVEDSLRETGIDPGLLTLELTESVCVSDLDLTAGVLRRLKDVGVSLSVDDFGTGYSSLSYIRKLPVDTLKIDQSFVREVSRDPDAASIVSAITGMARSLDLKTIAEGVELEEQRKILHLLRCDYGQGYLFSPAIPAGAFEAYCDAPAPPEPAELAV
jgi:diguanylate cyclase (GGDEF)-like protein/PAS domain S-box-containing protein